MKKRIAFVSNSSSTSYLIAFKTEIDKCEVCGRSDPSVLDAISNSSWPKTQIDAVGVDAILSDSWWAANDIGEKLESYVKEGFEVAEIRIAYGDDILNEIDAQVSKGNLVLIQNSEE